MLWKNTLKMKKRKFNNDVVKALAKYYNIKVSDIVDWLVTWMTRKKWGYHTHKYLSFPSLANGLVATDSLERKRYVRRKWIFSGFITI